MFHRLLAICQRKQDEVTPCSLLTTVLNRNLFKQINEHIDLLKLASYVPVVTLPLASSTPASAPAAADFAPFWHRSSSSGSTDTHGYQYQPQPQQQQYMFVSSIEEDTAAAASLFMPFFTLSVAEKDVIGGGESAVAGGGSSSSSSDSDDSDDSDEFGYFEDEESFG